MKEPYIWNISISNIERLALALEVEPWMLLKPVQLRLSVKEEMTGQKIIKGKVARS